MYSVDYLIVVGVATFTFFFAVGLGPIPWMIMAELFPTYAVSAATSIATMINWLGSFAVALLFEIIIQHLGHYTFLPFAATTLLFAMVIYARLPETKGKSLDQIVRMLDH